MKEIWKPIIGFEGYLVSNLGNIKSLPRTITGKDGVAKFFGGKLLTPTPSKVTERHPRPHFTVELWQNGKRVRRQVHRLVATAFIPNDKRHPVVNHIDGNPSNNSASNLEWCTFSYNNRHAARNGLKTDYKQKPIKGTHAITGEAITFNSVADAARYFGVTEGAIKAPLKGYGRAKLGCGYRWEYI